MQLAARLLIAFSFTAPLIWTVTVWAQNRDGGGGQALPHFHQIGVFTGKVLPNGVSTNDEIFSQSGARYSMPMGRSESGYYDFSFFGSNSGGVQWQSIAAGISMHFPIETLIGHAGLGVDLTSYSTSTTDSRVGGMHFIGGVMSRIGGNALFRFDMKLNSKPGTSLFFGAGIVLELDGGGNNAGGPE